MPDIQNSKELELQMAKLIPIFIENLGSPKVSIQCLFHVEAKCFLLGKWM